MGGKSLDDYGDLLTVAEVMAILRLSDTTIIRLLHAGEIPGVQIGKQWRIQKAKLLELLRGEE